MYKYLFNYIFGNITLIILDIRKKLVEELGVETIFRCDNLLRSYFFCFLYYLFP